MVTEASIENYQVRPHPYLGAWVTALESKLEFALLDYFSSNADQSVIFQNNVKSYIYTLSQFWQRPESCAEAVESDLVGLLSKRFKRAEVSVVSKILPEDDSKFDLHIEISVSDGQKQGAKSRVIVFSENGQLMKYVKLNNQGDVIYDSSRQYVQYNDRGL